MRISSDNPLVLGSASPRRRDLLATLGVPFVVCSADVDESAREGEAPEAYVERVALAKLRAVCARYPGKEAGVLVADTIVVAPDLTLLGKPRDDDEGRAMLERLAGATHQVSTRFVLAASSLHAEAQPDHSQTVTTQVTFRALLPSEIRAYVASGEGRDKAGSYAAQGNAAAFVERIDGSFTSVVGLPVCEVLIALRALGWLAAP
ncbi:MAG TPA: Maf family protein [Polyangiaceae bacterium]|nr:Maf family protein [Polyangiaceae bacterium]